MIPALVAAGAFFAVSAWFANEMRTAPTINDEVDDLTDVAEAVDVLKVRAEMHDELTEWSQLLREFPELQQAPVSEVGALVATIHDIRALEVTR